MKKLLFWSIMIVSLAACSDNNTITYTTTDGEIIDVSIGHPFDAEIVSNTYKNGEGKIVFDKPLTSIRQEAFSNELSLTSITIPNSVTSIGNWAFNDCESLTSPVYNAHCFAYMPTSYSGAYTIPEGIEQIAGGAFSDCESLTSVTIPNSVTSIGDFAFSDCKSLTSITIPNSVTSIGIGAFRECNSLTSVTIPNSVTSIKSIAFQGCRSLTFIEYTGTKEQWNKIELYKDWADKSYIQVIRCADGEIRL